MDFYIKVKDFHLKIYTTDKTNSLTDFEIRYLQ